MRLLLLVVVLSARPAVTIEDFDDGAVTLHSFSVEDVQPDSWRLDSLVTYDSSAFSLCVWGNSWKLESIPAVALESNSVWQVAAYVSSLGEIQGFGIVDSAHALLYSLAGTEEADPAVWNPVYQGAFPTGQWNRYRMPVGEDFRARFGYVPNVRGLVFVNDRDTDPTSVIYFDAITDITMDLPVAPRARAWHDQPQVGRQVAGAWDVTVQFHSEVTDPDSPEHEYNWQFGDDSTSADSNPVHTYTVTDDHEYTVLLTVRDSTGLWGRASCRVTIDPGPTTFPVRLNFVGDIMLARGYEQPGGIIDTLGVEGIFEPTRPWLGDAADITIANLESPLTTSTNRHPTKPIVFKGRPENAAGLAAAGVDVVSLANNHIIDYGLEGMRETQQVVESCGMVQSGAGANSYEAYLPLFRSESGVVFAFLASCDRNGQYDNYQPYLDAGYDKFGFAYLDSFHVGEQVRAVRDIADVVIVEGHTGEEYVPTPEEGVKGSRSQGVEWHEDEMYHPRAFIPAPGDTEERHRIIDAGADVFIGHHPHILQGFEVYHGKLIAHSLGDFVFDLSYTETYPSVILGALVDERGIYDYTLVPVYIDDWIPKPARGELGCQQLDYLARRSQELGTYVIVDRESVKAHIILDTASLTPWPVTFEKTLKLDSTGAYYVSSPARLVRQGSIAQVTSVAPAGAWQYRLGRELCWFGNMEAEGATEWLLEQADEYYDTFSYRGDRALCQRRAQLTGAIATNLEDRLLCNSDARLHTLHGHLATSNAESAGIAVRYYSSRTGGTMLGWSDLGRLVNGTTGWELHAKEFDPVAGTSYFDVVLSSTGPDAGGTGRAWFDDVGVIEWEDWQAMSGPMAVTCPNDYYWLQVRSGVRQDSAVVTYVENTWRPGGGAAENRGQLSVISRQLRARPNPSRAGTHIEFGVGTPGRVRLTLHDVTGQTVRRLLDGVRAAGRGHIAWDRRDDSGQRVAAGAYFLRLETPAGCGTTKLVLAD